MEEGRSTGPVTVFTVKKLKEIRHVRKNTGYEGALTGGPWGDRIRQHKEKCG